MIVARGAVSGAVLSDLTWDKKKRTGTRAKKGLLRRVCLEGFAAPSYVLFYHGNLLYQIKGFTNHSALLGMR